MERNHVASKRHDPFRVLAFACVLTAAIVVCLGWNSYSQYHEDKLTNERNVRIQQLRDRIVYLDEVLTMSARMAAATGDMGWEERYRAFEPQLDAAIREGISHLPESYSAAGAAGINAANIALVEMENHAFDLLHKGDIEGAQAALSSDEYVEKKEAYAKGMEQFDSFLEEIASTASQLGVNRAFFRIVAVIVVLVTIVAGWSLLLPTMRRWQAELSKRNSELGEQSTRLAALNKTLDQRVSERTKALDASEMAALNMMADAVEAKAVAEAAEAKVRATNALLEEETARANDLAAQAEMASTSKSEFLANMSHEIRTPMTAILGFSDLIAERCQRVCAFGQNQLPAHIDTIRRNGKHLLSLINDILDLSKIEAGKMTVEQGDCRPCHVIAEVASLMCGRADARSLAFKVEYIGSIPETIQSDATRLRQILINLVGNTIKFTETGSVRLVTRFVGDGDERRLQFDVIDTGCGMTEEQKASLFRPFTQADNSTTRKFGGTGLGLTISRSFAKLLGGDITIPTTELDVGTTFRVSTAVGSLSGVTMLEDPVSATVLAEDANAVAKTPQTDLHGLRILLAEDGPDNQRLISFILKEAGADVTVEENGELALDAALVAHDDGKPFDVILMDMQMPVLDGYEATGQLRQKGYTAPIIALTAHAMDSDRQKCIHAGCDDYATKPIDRKKLIETIQKQLVPGEAASAAAT